MFGEAAMDRAKSGVVIVAKDRIARVSRHRPVCRQRRVSRNVIGTIKRDFAGVTDFVRICRNDLL